MTAAIEQAEALTESDYTASTWAALETALTAAQTVLADADATQTEVDEATAALTAAIDALEKANTTEEVTVPAATTITSAVSWTKGIKLTWEAVDGATSYQVYRKIDSGSWKKVKTTSSTTWQDNDATTDSTQYQYKVYAVNSSGKSEASATKTIFRLASTTITSATNRATGVKLTWNAVEGATSYRIFRKVGSGSWKKVKTTSSTTWTDTSATKNGTKYQYKIDAVNSSDISAASATKTIYRLTAKKFTRAKNVSSKKISLKWTRNTQATGYIIQYSTSSSFSSSTTKTVKVKGNKNVTTTLKNLTKGKKYYIRMRAYKTSGSVTSYAGWSKVKTVTVKK
ncbi:MAG: fibronectin type III domain-containing protein [Clostridiales bacterium]|nr:fibronectin type III domain-containing protein [Clostridiales bacterium]